MKNILKSIRLGLIAVLALSVSVSVRAEVKFEGPLATEKMNHDVETLEQLARRFEQKKSFVFSIAEDRVLAVNHLPAAEGRPTFLLLPGVNRSFDITAPALELIGKLGNGIVTFDFSTHPLSVAKLEKNVKPYFLKKTVTLQDLASEVDALVASLKSQGVKNIIPVSLSYSGAVTPYLKEFPLIIETVPMTSAQGANPELDANIKRLKSLEIFNPFFGAAINRNLLDFGYRQQWSKQVEHIIELYKLDKDRSSDMVEGYLSMSRAVEGFDWKNLEIPKETRRAFVVADHEAADLLRDQAETFLRLSKENKNVVMFIVKNSGHVLPSDQPAAYGFLLNNVLGPQDFSDQLGGGIFDTETKTIDFKTREDMEKVIESFLENIGSAKSEKATGT